MLIVYKNENGDFSENQSPSFPKPVLLVGEEKVFFKEEGKDCVKISKIFNENSLRETSVPFETNYDRQFIALPYQTVIVCTLICKRTFKKSLNNIKNIIINSFEKNKCLIETENETSVLINTFYFSLQKKIIEKEPICSTTLAIFEKTDKLSVFANLVKKMVAES